MLNIERNPTVLRRHTSEVRTSVIATAALLALANRTLHGGAASLPTIMVCAVGTCERSSGACLGGWLCSNFIKTTAIGAGCFLQ